MSLIANTPAESARRKFFMNSIYIMSTKKESLVFRLRMLKWVQQPSARSNRREENFSSTRRTSCLQSRNNLLWAQDAKMSLTAISSLESARKKIFHELDVHHVYKVGITFFWAQDAKMSLTAISSLESARRKFSSTRRTSCLQSRNNWFLGSGCQNQSNSHQTARIGEKKIFHELDVHHVYKVGITCFWAQDAKMSLTAIISLESARRKFFNHVYKVGITCFCAQDAKISLTAISSLESARREFFMNSTYIMSTK